VRARDRGFLQGYRDEVRDCDLHWEGVSRRWRQGYADGRLIARYDLTYRITGPFDYIPQEIRDRVLAESLVTTSDTEQGTGS
jgi:hypothetical protein